MALLSPPMTMIIASCGYHILLNIAPDIQPYINQGRTLSEILIFLFLMKHHYLVMTSLTMLFVF